MSDDFARLPDGWRRTRLDRIASVKARIGWKALTAAEYQHDGYAFLATPNIKGREIDFEQVNYISEFRYEESPELKLCPGDVLLAKDGNTLGIVNLVKSLPRPATVNGSIAVIRPKAFDAAFLRYVLMSSPTQSRINAFKDGMGVPHLFQWDINRFPLPAPPIGTQRAIADYLDTETARIDALIDKKQRMIDLLDDRLSASIESVVAIEARGAPTPSLRWLLTEGISDGPHETPEFLDSGVPFISVDGIVDSELSFAKCRFISESDHARFSRKLRPRRGDVLVTKAASVGKVALVRSDVDFNVWSPIAVLRPDPSLVLPEFLWLYLRTQSAQRLLTLGSTSNTQQNISMRDLGSILVPLMPLARQRHVYEQVEAQAKRDARPRIAQSIELLRERRQALITAAVTGEFEVPGVAA